MSDTAKTIKCPACGMEMVKIFDPGINMSVDVCVNGCGGIFFDDKPTNDSFWKNLKRNEVLLWRKLPKCKKLA